MRPLLTCQDLLRTMASRAKAPRKEGGKGLQHASLVGASAQYKSQRKATVFERDSLDGRLFGCLDCIVGT